MGDSVSSQNEEALEGAGGETGGRRDPKLWSQQLAVPRKHSVQRKSSVTIDLRVQTPYTCCTRAYIQNCILITAWK